MDCSDAEIEGIKVIDEEPGSSDANRGKEAETSHCVARLDECSLKSYWIDWC